MHKKHLIIFLKNPVLGKVKTRLAADIGDEKALEVYKHLLELTRMVALKTDCIRHVFYSDEIEQDDWDDDRFNKFVQQGVLLGDRMKNAFKQVFVLGAENVVIIGSDCPELNSKILEDAFDLLDEHDVCIGPATDGGYYLLGMSSMYSYLFDHKQWSTDTVFEQTVADLKENGLSYAVMKPLSDVDTVKDLDLLEGRV